MRIYDTTSRALSSEIMILRFSAFATMRAAGALAMAVVCLLGLTACGELFDPPPRGEQDLNYSSLSALRGSSDRIVRLQLVRGQDFQIVDPMTLEELERLSYLTFTVLESFKGSADAGDELHVALPLGAVFVDGAGSAVALEAGGEYLLFLKGRARDSQYPIQFGGTIWSLNGEPSLAVVEGEVATFVRRGDRLDFRSALETVALADLR